MAGCFGSHPIDRWMEGQLNRYLDSGDDYLEFDFNARLRNGTVKVFCESSLVADRDEDGVSYGWSSKIKNVVWSFSNDAEISLTKDEDRHLRSLADDEAKEVAKDM